MLFINHTPIIALTTDHSPLTVYVEKLKRVYQTPPTTWLSLPNCKHIKLAMTNEKGTRYTREPDKLIEHRVKGEIEPLMASKVPVGMDSIFDEGIFENVHPPLVILVEGAFGSGKTTLAYHYRQKWAKGNLGMFYLVALVHLRHPAVHSAGFDFTLHQLLLLASDGEEGIDDIVTNVVQRIKDGLKFLLILDGWDEGPACLRAPPDSKHPTDNSYLGKLLRSVSSNTTILITSRPDSSIDLHDRPNVKRVEILGFTKKSIHEYFREALSTQLSSKILEDECRKIKDHLANYPAIESSCYIPLNAAILTLLYLQRDRTLPTTHFEMFRELLLCFIAREVNTRQPKRTLGTISSLDDLPRDLKKQLKHISILAYEGVMNSKYVFTQDELPSILPRSSWANILNFLSQILPTVATPAQQDLPAMGVLQRVQWAGTSSKTISYNFVHLSIQEMLAAYCISQMSNDEQVSVFQTLLKEPRFATVLQFYAGFTKLTNQGVCNIITGSDLTTNVSSQRYLLIYVRCFYEAQINNHSLYSNVFRRLNNILDMSEVTLSPLDCMSVGYFLALVCRNSTKLRVDLSRCGINDHSFGLMMGELSRHAEACPAGALHGVTELDISNNLIGDNGIALISTALQTNTSMTILNISTCNMSGDGAESLARALTANKTLQKLYVSWNNIGDNGVALISTALQTNTTMTTLNISGYNMSDDGAESLARALTVNKTLQELDVSYNNIGDTGIALIATALRTKNTLKILSIGGETATDDDAESLAAVLTANSYMKDLELHWSSKHPDSTLRNIGVCVSKSTLRKLHLEMKMPVSGEAPVTEERAKEWLQYVELGGKELILSLEDSHLEDLHLMLYYETHSYFKDKEHHSHHHHHQPDDDDKEHHQLNRSRQGLKTTAATVNTTRIQKGLPEIHTIFLDTNYYD